MKNENWGKEILEGLQDKAEDIKNEADLWIETFPNGETIFKWAKRLSLIGIGVLITSTVTVTTGEYNIMKRELTQKISYKEEDLQKYYKENRKLKDEKEELNKQVEIAQAYLELDENEKQIVDAKIDEVNKATEEQLAQEKAQKEAEEAAKKQAEEEAKRQEEAKKDSHIGETISFTSSDYSGVIGDWSLTINNVYKTDERNMFRDPINQVVVIEYTVENISIPSDDFYLSLEHDGEFYNSDGYKVSSYPGGDSVYNLSEGMKANGKAYIGIDNDTPYLEMHFGGVTYKWTF